MLAHAHKNIPFEIKNTIPGSEDEEFRQASPTGKVPGYKTDAGTTFADSSVIIAYLERTASENSLYPENNEDYAQALWFEEWADTELMQATGALYFQRVVGPIFFKHETDLARVDEILTTLIPKVFTLLESRLTEQAWLVGDDFSIADLAVGSCLISLLHAEYSIEQSNWPKIFSYNERLLALPIVQAQLSAEKSFFKAAIS